MSKRKGPGALIRPFLRNPILLLFICETVLFAFSIWLACGAHRPLTEKHWVHLVIYSSIMLMAQGSMGLYSRHQRAKLIGVMMRAIAAIAGGSMAIGLIAFAVRDLDIRPAVVAVSGLLSLSFVATIRLIFEHMTDGALFRRKVLVLGAGTSARRVAQLKGRIDEWGFIVHGFVFFPGDTLSKEVGPLVDPGEDLAEYCRREDIEEIVVAMDDPKHQLPFQWLLDARVTGIPVCRLIDFLERETGKVCIDVAHPGWIIFSDGFKQSAWKKLLSRIFDIGFALTLLFFASPFMLGAALIIKLTEGIRAPVIYSQNRVGFRGKLFKIYKFRSMRVDAEKNGAQWASKKDPRVTTFGNFMRKTRVDELPQLFNVLKGDMAVVGPRPERPEFVNNLEQMIPYYRERHAVKPGVTGWAQLSYPYGASERDSLEKLQYDLYYIKNHRLRFDLLIVLQTVETVLWGKGR